MTNPNDPIRRGDALTIPMSPSPEITGCYLAERDAVEAYKDAIASLPAVTSDRDARPKMSESDFDCLILDAMTEAMQAMRKFPQPNYVISKFAEEAGEVVKAAIYWG